MIPKENPPLTEGFNEEEIAQNRVIFCQKIKKKVKENIQDFIKTAYASTKDSIYCYSWKRAIKRLIRKYKLALKLKYFFIFLFAHRNYQCYRKKNENFFLLRRPYELLKACHEEFLFKLTEINNEKRLEEQRTNYVRSKEDFEKEIFKIKDEIVAGFSKMFDESSCLLNNLPVRMIKKTYAIQKKNKQLLSRYCETICDEKWLPTRFKVKMTKTSNGGKLYSVKKARKQIEKIAKNLEKTYWRYEVKKVNLLNKTPKKQTNLPSFTNDGLYLKDVFKFYTNGVHTFKVLDNINLEIKFGEFVVIFGPSGSGKTTLLNIISGIDRASSGYVYCDGVNLTELSDKLLTKFRRKNVGYIFQQYSLLPNLTAKENVEIGANLQKNYRLKIDVNLLLNDVGMLDKKDSLPVELSGGQQQRISIARAIAKNPLIIFADEPTAALDSNATKTIMNLFTNLNKKYKTTFVVVSHNELFEELADKLIRVGDGKIESIAIKKKC